MTNENLQVFTYEGDDIRTIKVDGEPCFVLKDVCAAFGEQNYRRVAARIDDEEKGVSQIATLGGPQNMTVVNESGLYSALFAMQPAKARGVDDEYVEARQKQLKKFKKWVTGEVLPSIRKTGGYIVGQEQMTDDELLSAALLVAQNKIAERDKRIAALSSKNKQLKETNEYLTPRSDYCDAVLQSTSTYTVTDIAKEYGWTAARMNTKLHDLGLQYFCKSKRGDKMITRWYLYSKFDGEGFVEYETTPYFDKETCEKKSSKHMRWTERGKAYIYERLKKEGILPRSEASRKIREG